MNWRTLNQLFIFAFITLVISLPALSNVQDYRYRKAFKVQRLSIEDGLAQSVVQDIIQDQDGYIWVATEDGLSRFDSYEFKTYRHDHKDRDSLHENWVVSLAEEPGKGLWIGTISGITFLDFKTQRFKNYTLGNRNIKVLVRRITRMEGGELYFATKNGLFYFDEISDQIVEFVSRDGKKFDSEIDSIADAGNYFYVSSGECLTRIEKATNALFNMCDLASLEKLSKRYILKILIDEEQLWLGTTNGLYLYNTVTDTLKEFSNDKNNPQSIVGNYIQDLALDGNNSLWIATTTGLDFYNKNNESFEHYTQKENSSEGLSSDEISTLWIDHEQLLWLGTYGGGINVLNPNQHKFEHILSKSEVAKLGKNNTIHGIAKDKNHNLWLASYGGGLIKYDLLSGAINKLVVFSDAELSEHIYSLYIDHQHRLWVGSEHQLSVVDLETEKKYKTQLVVDGILSNGIGRANQFHQDYIGDIYIVGDTGLYKVDRTESNGLEMTIYLSDLTKTLPVSFTNTSRTINAILDDKDGNYWIGGMAGLIYYQVEKNQYSHFTYQLDNPQSITNDTIQSIYEDSHGFIWIGSSDGLNRIIRSNIDTDTFYFERITTYEGLPNNSIYGILEDEDRKLWISTNLGLVRYANGAEASDSYRSADGLSSDEFNTASAFSDSGGRLYFGSINGVTIIDDVSPQKQLDNTRLDFTRVRVANREVDLHQLNQLDRPKIIQRTNEGAIDISVANISFSKLGTQRYRYRIIGLDEKWNYLGTRRNMFIAGLPEGSYRLEIQTQQSGMPWSSQSRLLDISVETSFWSSSQASYLMIIGFLLLSIAVIWMIVRHYQMLIAVTMKKTTLEALRGKEIRTDYESLKSKLEEKEKSIQSLNKRIEIGEKKLGTEKYRDVATGFYRLSYFYKLEGDELLDENASQGKGFDCYKSIGVLELKDYAKLFQKLGPLAASEFVSQLSRVIRHNLDSGIQLYQIQNGIFLILGCEIQYQDFEDKLLNLRHYIERTEVNIANGVSENSSVSFSSLSLELVTVSSKRQLDVIIDLLVQIHQQMNLTSNPLCQRITLNYLVSPKEFNKASWRYADLVEKRIIDIMTLVEKKL